ncbi:TlpA family protein disulfide reductase [Oxalobacteraceae bacterium OM1]|nr:TlpA family protein disulfide reductase [Oxalobacteraceae bacterium OM1]
MLSTSMRIGRSFCAVLVLASALCGASASAKDVHLQAWPQQLPTPALRLDALDGTPWNTDSLRGKVVVLNFWASWCEPCVDELPALNALATDESAKGDLVVLGVNFKESTAAIERFLSQHSVRYPVLMDKQGEHLKKWTSGVLPTTVLIGRDGRARWRVLGELDAADPGFKRALERLLEEPRQGNMRAGVAAK